MRSAQGEAVDSELSVYEEAIREAERHKWIESQKRGYDLGDSAIHEWYRTHWYPYCRQKCLEHVQGARRWREFGEERFGNLDSRTVEHDRLAQEILGRVAEGQENLDIILWALDNHLPLGRVHQILSRVDVNGGRLEPLPK